MNPALVAQLALAALELALPKIEELVREGKISPQEQQDLRDRYNALRGHAAFTGPEWVPSNAGTGDGSEVTRDNNPG